MLVSSTSSSSSSSSFLSLSDKDDFSKDLFNSLIVFNKLLFDDNLLLLLLISFLEVSIKIFGSVLIPFNNSIAYNDKSFDNRGLFNILYIGSSLLLNVNEIVLFLILFLTFAKYSSSPETNDVSFILLFSSTILFSLIVIRCFVLL